MAAQKRVGVVVFGPDGHARDIGEIAAHRSIPWLVLPPSADDFATAFAACAMPPRVPRTTERRLNTELTIFADGTSVFSDNDGRRWMVYDRRTAQERRADPTERVFVAVDGECRQIVLPIEDPGAPTVALLVDQLRRATFG